MVGTLAWVIFVGAVVALLVVDLVVVSGQLDVTKVRQAAIYSIGWVGLGVAFGGVVAAWLGASAAGEYYAGYLIEKSLSVDNVFVFAIIFSFFGVPDKFQHRILFWGIFGALVFRALFIFAGAALLAQFEWAVYGFGVLLLATAARLVLRGDEEPDPGKNPVLRILRRALPIGEKHHEGRFAVRAEEVDEEEREAAGRPWFGYIFTPLVAVLIVIETTDILFALDSIPAILGITRDEFIVFSSNAFALLGLRALYFVVAGGLKALEYLHFGLAAVLAFVGAKFILEGFGIHIGIVPSLITIVAALGVAVIASVVHDDEPEPENA